MKKIISKEINSLVQTAYETAAGKSFSDCSFGPMTIQSGFCLGIGRIQIVNGGVKTYLILAPELKKDYMQDWKKDVGDIFAKDCKKSNLSEYYKFETSSFTALLRKVSEEEYDTFKEAGHSFIKLGDFYYIVMKYMTPNQRFSQLENVENYFETPAVEPDEEEAEPEEVEIESLSLF